MDRRLLQNASASYGSTPKDKRLVGERKIWFNSNNIMGICCSGVCITFIIYAKVITVLLILNQNWTSYYGAVIFASLFMALWSHVMTMISDPGVIPYGARPLNITLALGFPLTMCIKCNTYKPILSHHDSVSNRCISRMDHFCEWTNAAIGAKNQKFYILFLTYLNSACLFSIVLFSIHLAAECDFVHCNEKTVLQIYLVRILVAFLVISIIFTSSMLFKQIYGIVTGLGTIDRIKLSKKEINCSRGPTPMNHIFGDNWYFWWLPVPPHFKDPETVFNYCLSSNHIGYSIDSSATT